MSNFNPPHLKRLIDETGVTPSVNQVELHPSFQQAGLRREHADRGIATEAWSPLAQGDVLDDEVIGRIADTHERTPAQVVLRWHIQLGNIVFPKSVTPARIEENLDIFGFHLSDEEMGEIEELDAGERIGPRPGHVRQAVASSVLADRVFERGADLGEAERVAEVEGAARHHAGAADDHVGELLAAQRDDRQLRRRARTPGG